MILKFMLPLAALGLAFGLRADPVQTITFKVLTTFGDPVEAKLVSLVAMHGKEISTNCQGLRCTNISEGAYSYSFVLASNQRKIDGNAVIYRTNQVVIVDVGTGPADLGDDDYPVVRGKVLHAGADASKLWVRLQPLYSEHGRTSCREECRSRWSPYH